MAAPPVVSSRGAMFNSAKCSVSKETQDLLNLMMKESKLTNFQRKKLNSSLYEGKPLPVSCGPTSSTQRSKASPTPATVPTVLNGRHLATLSGKRKKETIDILNENNQPGPYRPAPSRYISEKDKQKLQNKMAYGIDDVEAASTKNPKDVPRVAQPLYEPLDEFDEVLQQIEERREFLNDMEKLGQGKKYRTMIQTEISQKIRQLEVIDKKRTKELEEALKANK